MTGKLTPAQLLVKDYRETFTSLTKAVDEVLHYSARAGEKFSRAEATRRRKAIAKAIAPDLKRLAAWASRYGSQQ